MRSICRSFIHLWGDDSTNILAVDDNEQNLYLMEVMLKNKNYNVLLSKNGVEALDRLRENHIDLIISDILMPKMDGYRLIREVKKDEDLKDIPFIFYTATYTSKADEEFALDLGADRFIIKPEEPEVFLKDIGELISKTKKKHLGGSKEPEMDNETYLQIHNDRLIGKLETRIIQLQEANQTLENEICQKEELMGELEKSEKNYRDLVESINDVIFTLDKEGTITYISPIIKQVTGFNQEDLLGCNFVQMVHPDDAEQIEASIQLTLSGELEPAEFRICNKDREILFVRTSSRPSMEDGEVIGLRGVMVDITRHKYDEEEIKKSLREKEILLKEIHHRVKNNLQIISSMLDLQETYVEDNITAVTVLKESQNRVLSIALIYEMLYQSRDLSSIDFSIYLKQLLSNMYYSYGVTNILLDMDLENIYLNIETSIPLGLITTELVSNSLRHAFPDGKPGKLTVYFQSKDDTHQLVIADDGIGFPEDVDFRNIESSLGLRLEYLRYCLSSIDASKSALLSTVGCRSPLGCGTHWWVFWSYS